MLHFPFLSSQVFTIFAKINTSLVKTHQLTIEFAASEQTKPTKIQQTCEECKVQNAKCNFLSKCFRQKGHKTFAVANWQTARLQQQLLRMLLWLSLVFCSQFTHTLGTHTRHTHTVDKARSK